MSLRYPAAIVLTLAVLFAAPGVAAKKARTRPHPTDTQWPPVREVYSQRALRRARILLQLKLLELRQERLERVRKAIERGLSIDGLLLGP
jgi:hypothetical protein